MYLHCYILLLLLVYSEVGALNWTIATSSTPYEAGYLTSATNNNKLFVMGGHDHRGPVSFNGVWSSVNGGSTWITSSAAWSERAGLVALYHNGKIYVTGGKDSSGTYFHDVWSSGDEGMTWMEVTATNPAP